MKTAMAPGELWARFARSSGVLLVACLLFAAPGLAFAKLKVGDMPPPRLNRSIRLSDYRGKIVIISFWASWCPPCRKEMSLLASLQKKATRDKLVVFAVNWRQDVETFWRIQRALRGVDLTLVSDSSGYIGRQYDIDAIPHMVILGRDGRIAAIHLGYGESEIPALVEEINSLWNQPAQPATQPSQPGTQRSRPGTQRSQPATQPSQPAAQPSQPAAEPLQPSAAPRRPSTPAPQSLFAG